MLKGSMKKVIILEDKKKNELDCLNSAIVVGLQSGSEETKRILKLHDCEDMECDERPDFIRKNVEYNCLLGIEHFRVDHYVKKKRGKIQSTGVMNKKEILNVYNTHRDSVLSSEEVSSDAINDIMKTVSDQLDRKNRATYKNFMCSFESVLKKHEQCLDDYREKLMQIKQGENISMTLLIEVYTDFSELYLNRFTTTKANEDGLMPFFKDIVRNIQQIDNNKVQYLIFYLKNYQNSKSAVYAFDTSDLMESFRKQHIDIYEYTGADMYIEPFNAVDKIKMGADGFVREDDKITMNFMADCSNIDPEERVYMIFLSVKKALRYKQLNVKYVCDRQTLECLYVFGDYICGWSKVEGRSGIYTPIIRHMSNRMRDNRYRQFDEKFGISNEQQQF